MGSDLVNKGPQPPAYCSVNKHTL